MVFAAIAALPKAAGAVKKLSQSASGCPPKPTLRERFLLCSNPSTRETKCAQCWSHFPSLSLKNGEYVFGPGFPASQDEKDLIKQGIISMPNTADNASAADARNSDITIHDAMAPKPASSNTPPGISITPLILVLVVVLFIFVLRK